MASLLHNCLLIVAAMVGVIAHLTLEDPPSCPESCVCRSDEEQAVGRRAKSVTCTGLGQAELTLVSQMSSTTVEVLRMPNTTIRRVDFFTLRRLPGLVLLDLNSNGINEIAGTGRTLPKLRILDLSGNNLHIIQPYAFRDFPQLASLNLSGNGLHTISPSCFLLPTLKVLDLRRNRLSVLKAHFFAHTPNLLEVYLTRNSLSRIPSSVFEHSLHILDLSNNHIIRLEDSAFDGINISGRLNLAQNSLRAVPNTALKRVGHVRQLVLDANLFRVLGAGALVSVAVTSLSVSNLRHLHFIHREAFLNLIDLEELRIRDNQALTYVHPKCLVNSPKLRVLDLSNNNLITLEEELLKGIPEVTELRVANNRFICHCSLSWLQNATQDEVFCSQMNNGSLMAVMQLPPASSSCSPYIMPLFPVTYHETLGNNASFHCRALGAPNEEVNWFSKTGQRLCNGKCAGRLCVSDHTLTVQYLHRGDSGTYKCVARNEVGEDTRSVALHVRDVNVHLLPLSITSTFVTLSWNMSNSISSNYILKYVEVVNRSSEIATSSAPTPKSVTFSVGHKMHSYTIHGLRPGSTYSFSLCIQREEYTVVISSISVTTRRESFLLTVGIERNYLSVIVVSVAVGIVLATCFTFCGLRCWRQRIKLQHESAEPRKSGSGCSGRTVLQSSSTHSNMAFITYIDLTDDTLLVDRSTESNLTEFA